MFNRTLSVKLRVAIIILLVFLFGDLITAYVFGFLAQKDFDRQFQYIANSPFIKVTRHEYRRGIFSSEEITELSLNSTVLNNILQILPEPPAKNTQTLQEESTRIATSYKISYATHIEHGLFAGVLNGYFVPTFAYAKTRFNYPPALDKFLHSFFKEKQPLKIENILYLTHGGRYEISSPGFLYDEAVSGVNVKWGGLDLVVKYNNHFDKFSNFLKIPSFSLTAPTKGDLRFNDFIYSSSSSLSANKIKVGSTNLELGVLKVNFKDKVALNLKFGDIIAALTGINSAEFLNGIDAINPTDFLLTHVSYNSTSEDVNNYFNAAATTTFESLVTHNKLYGPMHLKVSLEHILAPQFSALIDDITILSGSTAIAVAGSNSDGRDNIDNNNKKQQMIAQLKQQLEPILVDKPLIKLDDFTLNTPDGQIGLHGFATTNNFTPNAIDDQKKFMHALDVDIYFSVPRPVMAYLFVLQMKYLLSAGNAQMDEQSSQALNKVVNILLDNQIVVWSKKGYIKNDNGILQSHLKYKGGKLNLSVD